MQRRFATPVPRVADLEVKQAQNVRRASLTTLSTSTEEKQVYDGAAKMAEAARQAAQAQVVQAEINLKRTEVVSPVDGYVTNLLMRVGDYARAGVYNISVIDSKSFWVDGYFEETNIGSIHVGDPADIKLMGYGEIVGGYVARILRGEKPIDLPVQQATRIELLINLMTAKMLAVAFPTGLLVRADHVIE